MNNLSHFRRPISLVLEKFLNRKLVLLSGPRQTGKTVLSRSLFNQKIYYLTYDDADDRSILMKKGWPHGGPGSDYDLLVLDELHKMRKWKSWLKGIVDKSLFERGNLRPRILVTGSARLDTYRKGGESMAGRFLALRLHPFSCAELKDQILPDKTLERILNFGGFPEPFVLNNETEVKLWRKTHLDRIIREDLLDLEKVRELKAIEILVDLLSERVGGTVSMKSLAEDLQVSPHSVRKWLEILENLYVIFRVTPYSKNVARSLLKEPKFYFFDTGRVRNGLAARIENAAACALLKRCHFLEDTQGEQCMLHYLRDQQKHEVDFLTVRNGKPEWMVEIKESSTSVSKAFHYFSQRMNPSMAIQAVFKLERPQKNKDIHICRLSDWLGSFEA